MVICTKPIRLSIKIAGKISHSLKHDVLKPNPRDFGIRLTEDLINICLNIHKIQKISSIVLDGYSKYLETNISGQIDNTLLYANNILDKYDSYSSYILNQGVDLGKGYIDNSTGYIDVALKINNSTIKGNYTDLLLNTPLNVKSNESDEIFNSVNEENNKSNSLIGGILSDMTQVDNKLKSTTSSLTKESEKYVGITKNYINKGNEYIGIGKEKVDNLKNGLTNFASSSLTSSSNYVKSFLQKIKEQTNELGYIVDNEFNVEGLANNLRFYGRKYDKEENWKNYATDEMLNNATNRGSIVQNFNIIRCVKAFTSISSTVSAIKYGIGLLPPLNVEELVNKIKGDELSYLDNENSLDDLVEYDDGKYKELIESYKEELQNQRNEIRKKRALKKLGLYLRNEDSESTINSKMNFYKNIDSKKEKELKSAIKSIKKLKDTTSECKEITKYKTILNEELDLLNKNCIKLSNHFLKEWNDMIKTYISSMKEIYDYYTFNGHADKFIDDVCDDIDRKATSLFEACVIHLPILLSNMGFDVALPRAIGLCITNPAQHSTSFIINLKNAYKLIKNIYEYITDIINDITILAKIIWDGISKLSDIIKKLRSLFQVDWMENLASKITNDYKELIQRESINLENSLTPIYLKDTEEFISWLERVSSFDFIDEKDIDKAEENASKYIVAYKSPVFERDENGNIDPEKLKGWRYYHPDLNHLKTFEQIEIKNGVMAKQWVSNSKYFTYKNVSELNSKIENRSRYIKIAAKKNSNKMGVNYLRNKKVTDFTLDYEYSDFNSRKSREDYGKNIFDGFNAFYWYFVKTDDITDTTIKGDIDDNGNYYEDIDETEGDIISPNNSQLIKTTENGSVVRITNETGTHTVFIKDKYVKSGDIVNVNGKRYRIKI